MRLVFFESTFVPPPVWEDQQPLAVLLAFLEAADILAAIRPSVSAFAMHQAVSPLAFVDRVVRPQIPPFVSLVILEATFEDLAMLYQSAFELLTKEPDAFETHVSFGQLAFAVLLASHELAFVAFSRQQQLTLSIVLVVEPSSLVRDSFGTHHLSVASPSILPEVAHILRSVWEVKLPEAFP